MTGTDARILEMLERKVLWLATWMIHHANHLRRNTDNLKVGGHQASSASLSTIMTALYFAVLRPEDRVAVKPHASPNFHAIQYLLGRQSRENLEKFRAFGGAQSYPSRTKDTDDVDFSTGSVGLGVAQTLFASLVQDYLHAKGWGEKAPEGRMIALVGDAEMDEGNIFECLQEGWKHGLRNTWWIVDYNRQSLDGVVHEGLWERFESMFRNFGWDVIVLRHGSLQQAAFALPGGEALRAWICACPNPLYSALTFQGGAAWRKRLLDDLGMDQDAQALIESFSDEQLSAVMANLGGHDLPMLLEAFEAARTHDRPVCFIAYTIKGYGLPLAGHKDNHAGLMTPDQIQRLRERLHIRQGHEWERFEGLDEAHALLGSFLDAVPFAQDGARRHRAAVQPVPTMPPLSPQKTLSTQQGFGLLMHEIGKQKNALADRIVTTSPDVTVSTNLGAWVNRRGLFARANLADTFRAERVVSTFNWSFSPDGQHIELGIAEMNFFILLSALGLSHALFGERLLPVGTLYDPFIERGLDALNYACYQDARFLVVATPSGITLAPEGGAHQSIATPLIGMAQDGLQSFEPAFVDELSAIMGWSFDYIQRSGDDTPDRRTCLTDDKGGAVYLRLSTRPIEQPVRPMTDPLRQDIIDGGYWMRHPGPNAELVIAYSGAVAPEAIEAVGLMAEDRRDVGLLAITSADRLHAGWNAASRLRESGDREAISHIERLLREVPQDCGLLTVQDGHPAALAWLGGVMGHRTRALGVEHFGQTGSIQDLYRHAGIDVEGLLASAQALSPARPIRY
ncbi:MAG TPA: transketolase [Acidisoma sp.]|uniref:transketolase n=1 Tax=Acidisoma sp. TaxID=1872115 RepID=UPI002BC81527|nr:transketolase [Acidisoma sp.]HTI00761.1 transketolase [Acidisoma sp.]